VNAHQRRKWRRKCEREARRVMDTEYAWVTDAQGRGWILATLVDFELAYPRMLRQRRRASDIPF
jgi:hypothetical protein